MVQGSVLHLLRKMESLIEQYEQEDISLGRLVSNLEALRSMCDDDFPLADFDVLWGKLEDSYSMMRYDNRTDPNASEIDSISEALAGLKSGILDFTKS